jgi:hypothetical protein
MPFQVVTGPFLRYILPIVVILGVGFGIHRHGYSSGVDDTVEMYETKMAQEEKRIQKANEEALDEARKAEEQLRSQLSARNETIKLLTIESMAAPGASDQCLDSEWVRRLDKIR